MYDIIPYFQNYFFILLQYLVIRIQITMHIVLMIKYTTRQTILLYVAGGRTSAARERALHSHSVTHRGRWQSSG